MAIAGDWSDREMGTCWDVSVWEDRYLGLHNINYPFYESAERTLSRTARNIPQQKVERVRGRRQVDPGSIKVHFLLI